MVIRVSVLLFLLEDEESNLCTALRLPTPPMETPDPPSDTPGASKQVVLTPLDILRSLRANPFAGMKFESSVVDDVIDNRSPVLVRVPIAADLKNPET